jgi:diguanylate cyclase (GGDEF)-like protein
LLRMGAWSGEVLVNAAGSGAVPMYVSTTVTLGPGGETNGGVVYAHELPRVGTASDTRESDIDEVTGVLARRAFEARVSSALDDTDRDGEACALVLAEITDADDLIAKFGVLTAASVMRALARRMTSIARTIDVVGCVGESQLALLLRGVRSHGEALRIGRVVHETLVDPPVTTTSGEVAVTIGCGVAFAKRQDTFVDLIQRASSTISRDAPTRDGAADTPDARSDRSVTSATMEDFLVGLSHGDVRAYAQPVVELPSGRVIGYQGLARWHHRALGMLEAAAFTDLVVDTSLASQVDLYLAREIAAALVLTTRETSLRLYAPVSKRLIADVRTEQYLSEIADAFFLCMHQMRLQLARPLLDNWSPALQDALQSLGDADVGLVLTEVEHISDADFLGECLFHELHISRRLTNAAATDPDARRTVSEIVRLAHAHELLVGATGVDDRQHQDVLVEAGCDLATGDLYGGPEPTNAID